ncbi:MAG: hypothetical protein GTO46_05880 [Gemmatimonadetes bacterium]|nr:hypothetical protein [Gemmatimonadota bacterium]NIO31138.1 hypothetical protein [Gemmatimonadota bacterium]
MSARISRILGLLIVSMTAATIWPQAVAAQSDATKQHEVDFFLGGLYTQNKLPLNAGFNSGFRYAYGVFQDFWLEFETGLTFTNDAETDGLLGHAQVQVRWHPLRSLWPADPFLLVGAGAAGYNAVSASESTPVIVLGLGCEFHWLEGVAFRLDVGDIWLTDMLGESSHNFRVSWGPVFRF